MLFIEELGRRVKEEGLHPGVPTSLGTRLLCLEQGIPLMDVTRCDHLDLTIDGADELTLPSMPLKAGAAHTSEKIIASMADQFILIADKTKMVSSFAENFHYLLK